MDSKYTGSIRGFTAKHGFFKSVHKGEDAWTQKPGVSFTGRIGGEPTGDVIMDFFGVFDGHGGKQAATFASRHLLEKLQAALQSVGHKPGGASQEEMPQDLRDCPHLSPKDWAAWAGQERLVCALPQAFASAFQELQADFFQSTKESGTTATAAVLAGWDLIVANVGDSCAFLDTGSEVLQVSGNHRLESNKREQQRLRDLGCEVSPSTLDGKPCGPLRVWPGGLAMSRTLGDFDAGEAVLAEPEVRHVTLPESGGRIVIASDGLWDAVSAKTALNHVRGMPANKAARDLVAAALKAKGLRDDITVLVIDALPNGQQRLPPNARPSDASPAVVHCMADPSHCDSWHRHLWQRRLQAVRAAFPPVEQPEVEASSDSLDSSGTMLADPEGSEEVCDSDSSGSERPRSRFAGGAFAALLEDEEYASEVEPQGAGWETVPAKSKAMPSKAVPSSGRKHSLAPSTSPGEAWQVPKALKEAPPSPMQTSEASSLSSGAGVGPRRARGRGARGSRGRGQTSGGRGQNGSNAAARPPRHIDGFRIRADQAQADPRGPGPPGMQPSPFPAGVTFHDGGAAGSGFSFGSIQFGSFGQDAAPDGIPPSDAGRDHHKAGKGAYRGRGRGRSRGGRGRGRRSPDTPAPVPASA